MGRQEKLLETIMGLIMHGENAKSIAMEGIYAAKSGEFEEATQKLADADKSLKSGHRSQTALLTREASGDTVELSLLLVHGQDHLMNAITFKDLAVEIIDLHSKFSH